jgi:hypothetical protein
MLYIDASNIFPTAGRSKLTDCFIVATSAELWHDCKSQAASDYGCEKDDMGLGVRFSP